MGQGKRDNGTPGFLNRSTAPVSPITMYIIGRYFSFILLCGLNQWLENMHGNCSMLAQSGVGTRLKKSLARFLKLNCSSNFQLKAVE
jgi:hypothetical protein